MNWYKQTNQSELFYQLSLLRPQMANAAQQIYNDWDPNTSDVGGGGICDEISQAIMEVIVMNISDVNTIEGSQDGDDHSWVVAYNSTEAYGVDIPYEVYERGGGYSWTKIPGVVFKPEHVDIFKLDIPIENLMEDSM